VKHNDKACRPWDKAIAILIVCIFFINSFSFAQSDTLAPRVGNPDVYEAMWDRMQDDHQIHIDEHILRHRDQIKSISDPLLQPLHHEFNKYIETSDYTEMLSDLNSALAKAGGQIQVLLLKPDQSPPAFYGRTVWGHAGTFVTAYAYENELNSPMLRRKIIGRLFHEIRARSTLLKDKVDKELRLKNPSSLPEKLLLAFRETEKFERESEEIQTQIERCGMIMSPVLRKEFAELKFDTHPSSMYRDYASGSPEAKDYVRSQIENAARRICEDPVVRLLNPRVENLDNGVYVTIADPHDRSVDLWRFVISFNKQSGVVNLSQIKLMPPGPGPKNFINTNPVDLADRMKKFLNDCKSDPDFMSLSYNPGQTQNHTLRMESSDSEMQKYTHGFNVRILDKSSYTFAVLPGSIEGTLLSINGRKILYPNSDNKVPSLAEGWAAGETANSILSSIIQSIVRQAYMYPVFRPLNNAWNNKSSPFERLNPSIEVNIAYSKDYVYVTVNDKYKYRIDRKNAKIVKVLNGSGQYEELGSGRELFPLAVAMFPLYFDNYSAQNLRGMNMDKVFVNLPRKPKPQSNVSTIKVSHSPNHLRPEEILSETAYTVKCNRGSGNIEYFHRADMCGFFTLGNDSLLKISSGQVVRFNNGYLSRLLAYIYRLGVENSIPNCMTLGQIDVKIRYTTNYVCVIVNDCLHYHIDRVNPEKVEELLGDGIKNLSVTSNGYPVRVDILAKFFVTLPLMADDVIYPLLVILSDEVAYLKTPEELRIEADEDWVRLRVEDAQLLGESITADGRLLMIVNEVKDLIAASRDENFIDVVKYLSTHYGNNISNAAYHATYKMLTFFYGRRLIVIKMLKDGSLFSFVRDGREFQKPEDKDEPFRGAANEDGFIASTGHKTLRDWLKEHDARNEAYRIVPDIEKRYGIKIYVVPNLPVSAHYAIRDEIVYVRASNDDSGRMCLSSGGEEDLYHEIYELLGIIRYGFNAFGRGASGSKTTIEGKTPKERLEYLRVWWLAANRETDKAKKGAMLYSLVNWLGSGETDRSIKDVLKKMHDEAPPISTQEDSGNMFNCIKVMHKLTHPVSVKELMSIYGSPEATVRMEINMLEAMSLVVRTGEGAARDPYKYSLHPMLKGLSDEDISDVCDVGVELNGTTKKVLDGYGILDMTDKTQGKIIEVVQNIIHDENRNIGTNIPEGKVLWHVIVNGLIPEEQQKMGLITKINQLSKRSDRPERIRILNENENLGKVLADLSSDKSNIVHVILNDEKYIDDMPNGVKMVVLKGELGNYTQLEGVVAISRALTLPADQRNEKLRRLYKILTGEEFIGALPDSPVALARAIIFRLPKIVILDPGELIRVNDNMIFLIRSA